MTAAIFNTGNCWGYAIVLGSTIRGMSCDFDDFGEELLSVQMESIMNQLDEVVIRRYSNVCSFIRRYTCRNPIQRQNVKLKTATALTTAAAGSMAEVQSH
jgi:hypothetical protein